jgi:hypothetical protein
MDPAGLYAAMIRYCLVAGCVLGLMQQECV